jgi:DNA adenine methylase
VYQEVRDKPGDVWEELENLISGYKRSNDTNSFYYRVREDFNLSAPRGDASRFMFLMATGFNGVYRTNSKGQFNVPHGTQDKTPKFPSENEIYVASIVLKHADLRACSWETSLSAASSGDFVFLDPPYLGVGNQDSRIYETERAFGFRDQERLAFELVNLKNRSVDFMLTNSASRELLELYKDLRLNVEVVSSRRSINSKTEDRGEEAELIVTPGDLETDRSQHEIDLDLKIRMLRARIWPRINRSRGYCWQEFECLGDQRLRNP